MQAKHYDLIVFGGRNAISTAIQCGAKGMQVALVEKGPLGGTCPHRGCIPWKLLIGCADAAECARAARRFGFETTVRVPDPDAILLDTFEFKSKYDSILENALGKNVTPYRSQVRLPPTELSGSTITLSLPTNSSWRPAAARNVLRSSFHTGRAMTSLNSRKCRSLSQSSAAAILRASLAISSTVSVWTR